MKKVIFMLMVIYGCICQATPVQWTTTSGGNGHWYEVVLFPDDVTEAEIALAIEAMGEPYAVIGENGIGWWEAGVVAQSRRGYLASIQSQAENEFIFSLINNPVYWNSGTGPWFGGIQDIYSEDYYEPDGAWVWSNELLSPTIPFNSTTYESMAYTNWYGLEPNNGGGYENVAHFCTEGTSLDPSPYWNDRASNIPCSSFVIEYNVPEPATIFLVSLGGLILRKKK